METQIYGFLVTQLDGTPPDNMINLQPSKGNIETQLDGLPGTRLVDITYSQPEILQCSLMAFMGLMT